MDPCRLRTACARRHARATCPTNAEGALAESFLPRGDMTTMPASAGTRRLLDAVLYVQRAGSPCLGRRTCRARSRLRIRGSASDPGRRGPAPVPALRPDRQLEGMARTPAAADREAMPGPATAAFVLAAVPLRRLAGGVK